ncbi:hypothetical protein BCR39DRAFT_508310 [Naematelia encephala]|uniref:Uncharacterized protein n=1 Tax=Naematelia encephala TaxID=71784 RepID=A0A1Y2AIA1_9TREE|nr:hypothetical protein BCR39DRAFT_508310 [Naematelia encephala]
MDPSHSLPSVRRIEPIISTRPPPPFILGEPFDTYFGLPEDLHGHKEITRVVTSCGRVSTLCIIQSSVNTSVPAILVDLNYNLSAPPTIEQWLRYIMTNPFTLPLQTPTFHRSLSIYQDQRSDYHSSVAPQLPLKPGKLSATPRFSPPDRYPHSRVQDGSTYLGSSLSVVLYLWKSGLKVSRVKVNRGRPDTTSYQLEVTLSGGARLPLLTEHVLSPLRDVSAQITKSDFYAAQNLTGNLIPNHSVLFFVGAYSAQYLLKGRYEHSNGLHARACHLGSTSSFRPIYIGNRNQCHLSLRDRIAACAGVSMASSSAQAALGLIVFVDFTFGAASMSFAYCGDFLDPPEAVDYWSGESGIGGTVTFTFILAYFFLAEMKNRSHRELNMLFHRRVPARKPRPTEIGIQEDE